MTDTAPHEYVPPGPLDSSPGGGYRDPEIRREALAAVLSGVETGDWDEEVLDWLARLDDSTCRTVASLLWRCRLAGQTWANLPAGEEAPLRIGPVIFPVGHVHLDSDGIERVKNRWGFNSFTTQEGAGESLRQLARRGTWYIWRLADGSYTFTAVPDPSTPGHPAELVEEVIAGA